MKKFLSTLSALAVMVIICQGQANTKLSNLVAPTAVNADLLPGSSNTRNLGSKINAWKSLYVTSQCHINGVLFLHNKGTNNTFLGDSAGRAITRGNYNTAIGYRALFLDTSGSNNAALGSNALSKNTNGYSNTAVGSGALQLNTSGFFNVATGVAALQFNTTGNQNTANGASALASNTTGYNNTAVGYQALASSTTGSQSTAIGSTALKFTTTGYYNTAIGYAALYKNTTGYSNSAIGINALYNNSTGRSNVAIGHEALNANTTGNANTAVGYLTGHLGTGGSYNTHLGYNAGYRQTNSSTFLGATTYSAAGLTNITMVGYNANTTASNVVRIGNASITSIGGYVGWSNLSDGRFKKDIREDVPGLTFINQLRPVTYHLDVENIENTNEANVFESGKEGSGTGKESRPQHSEEEIKARQDKSKILYTGFVAQDVEAAAKKLGYDFSGVDAPKNEKDFYGLRYAEFVVPLVKAVQEVDASGKKKDERILKLEHEVAELKQMLMDLKNGTAGHATLNASSAFLEQNTPNPSDGSTIIRYHIPSDIVSAKLIITDMKGRIIKTVVLTKGTGQITLDSRALAAGSYNYTLYVNNKQADTKQMIITK